MVQPAEQTVVQQAAAEQAVVQPDAKEQPAVQPIERSAVQPTE